MITEPVYLPGGRPVVLTTTPRFPGVVKTTAEKGLVPAVITSPSQGAPVIVVAEARKFTAALLPVPKMDRVCCEKVFDGKLNVREVGNTDRPIVGLLPVTFSVTGIVS